MNTAAIKVETVTRVTLPGNLPVDASLLSDDQLIAAIQASEKQSKALGELTTPSAAITAKIAELEAGATALAAILDARLDKKKV